jgi:hypothetical protein
MKNVMTHLAASLLEPTTQLTLRPSLELQPTQQKKKQAIKKSIYLTMEMDVKNDSACSASFTRTPLPFLAFL